MPKKTNKIGKISKKETKKNPKARNKPSDIDLSYAKEDKMLKKVENYGDKNWEKTSQEILERKSRRPSKDYKEADLEVMISRINSESKPKVKVKELSKWIIYIIYMIIIIAILIFLIKYFFVWNLPQIS